MSSIAQHELPLGRTPKRVILIMEIGSRFAGLVKKKTMDFDDFLGSLTNQVRMGKTLGILKIQTKSKTPLNTPPSLTQKTYLANDFIF